MSKEAEDEERQELMKANMSVTYLDVLLFCRK
jgi:hypothetical protein